MLRNRLEKLESVMINVGLVMRSRAGPHQVC